MMSGLRSHLEYTITCVSDRSGIASSFVFFIECQPRSRATLMNKKTRNLFSAQMSIIRLIMLLGLRQHFRQAPQNTSVLCHKCFCCFSLAERKRTGRATIECQLFHVLGFIHLGHVVLTSDHAAVFDKPCPFWTHHLSRGIVRHLDQPQWLLLLSRLRHRTVRTADVSPSPTDFRHCVCFGIDV